MSVHIQLPFALRVVSLLNFREQKSFALEGTLSSDRQDTDMSLKRFSMQLCVAEQSRVIWNVFRVNTRSTL